MPTYDYRCEACGHEFEEFQSITAPHLKKCPACKKSKLKRLIGTGGAMIFKGSGFYLTDYRSESYKKAAKADQEAQSKSGGSGGGSGAGEGTSSSSSSSSKDSGSKSSSSSAKAGDSKSTSAKD